MDLSTEFAGIKLKNPLMPASGPLVGDDEKMLYLARLGVGGMVTKTISTKAAEVPRPCIYGTNNYIVNAELWSELPPEKWINEILPKLKKELDLPLVVSAGYTKEDMEILIPQLDKFADAFEISTHYVGKNLDNIAETVRTIRANTDKPIFMKMSPHIPDPVEFAKMVLANGGTGVVAINSLGPTMLIDIENRTNLIGNDKGQVWISGPVIKNLGLALVNTIKTAVPEIPVIGVGGIASADDVIEYLLAGADAVQMLSAALIRGKQLYKTIVDQLPKALEKYGFNSIDEVKKTGLKKKEVVFEPKYPKIDLNKCTFCKLCEMVCPYWAITVDKENKQVIVDEDKCFGCSLCQSRCPVKAISGVI